MSEGRGGGAEGVLPTIARVAGGSVAAGEAGGTGISAGTTGAAGGWSATVSAGVGAGVGIGVNSAALGVGMAATETAGPGSATGVGTGTAADGELGSPGKSVTGMAIGTGASLLTSLVEGEGLGGVPSGVGTGLGVGPSPLVWEESPGLAMLIEASLPKVDGASATPFVAGGGVVTTGPDLAGVFNQAAIGLRQNHSTTRKSTIKNAMTPTVAMRFSRSRRARRGEAPTVSRGTRCQGRDSCGSSMGPVCTVPGLEAIISPMPGWAAFSAVSVSGRDRGIRALGGAPATAGSSSSSFRNDSTSSSCSRGSREMDCNLARKRESCPEPVPRLVSALRVPCSDEDGMAAPAGAASSLGVGTGEGAATAGGSGSATSPGS